MRSAPLPSAYASNGGEGGIRFASETLLSATYRLAVATDASDPMGAGKHCPMLPDDIKLREVQ